jgi:hypothetical protein
MVLSACNEVHGVKLTCGRVACHDDGGLHSVAPYNCHRRVALSITRLQDAVELHAQRVQLGSWQRGEGGLLAPSRQSELVPVADPHTGTT